MGGIIWLASYPKSGNTWVRSFLQNLILNPAKSVHINELSQFAYGDGQKYWYEQAAGGKLDGLSPEEVMKLTPKAHHLMTRSRPQSVFVKTHNFLGKNWDVPFITAEETAGAIHIVRNPLDVSISLAHHFGFSIDEAIDFMNNPDAQTPEDDYKLAQVYGTWSSHVASWEKFNPQYLHRMRYEDMLFKPGATFSKLAKFLGINPPKNILAKAIKNSSFKSLKEQEKKDGFIERSDKAESFFRSGKAGGWRQELTEEQVKRVVDVHGEKMAEYGYLKGVKV
ncbi:sulfotransferase domain-containing protein [Sneathiella limimaris]|uniref:sulfotransferase domain-containing protein n=1 Tax=Sneathiella limimaris TaxID=1964213 RepID=UPI00146B7EBF|nr:sulfotransferase domain-containing protein [Sneathiella limimaris]